MVIKIVSMLVSFGIAAALLAGGSWATFGVWLTWGMVALDMLAIAGLLMDTVNQKTLEKLCGWPARLRALVSNGAHVAALVYVGYPGAAAVLTLTVLMIFVFAAGALENAKREATNV